ncbi:MAG: helix-turn-helix domain-containing protein [Candidatus Thorarchaeota archaeon]
MANLGLESLDLNFQESKVYIFLLALGPLSLGEIIKNTEFTSEDAIKTIEGLQNKGYVHQIPGIASRYNAILPFNDLKASADTTISQMEALAAQLDEHIAKKLEIILGKMKEESQKISDGIGAAQTAINKTEMKSEGDIEARIARYTLEVEQGTDETKTNISNIFETKQSDHQALVSNLRETYTQKANEMGTSFNQTNQAFLEKYQGGVSELETAESERNQALTTQIDNLVSKSQEFLTQGIQNVHQSMETTGQVIYQSIDERNEKLNIHISNITSEMVQNVTKISDDNQLKVGSCLESYNEKLHQQLDANKQNAVGSFTSTRDEIKTKSVGSAENLQQALNESLVAIQNQLIEMLQQAQETLSQKVLEARNQVQTTIEEFSEAVQVQTDSDIQKIIINTESTFGGLAQDTQNTYEQTRESVNTTFNEMTSNTRNKTEEIKGTALLELNRIVNTFKTEINSQLEQFKQTMKPQDQQLKDELTKFKTEVTTSRSLALESFRTMMEEFKTAVITKHQEMEILATQETNILSENINQFIEEINGQIKEYDSNFNTTLTETAVKMSEKLIVQTRELQEKMVAVVSEMSKSASDQLTTTSQLISSSIQAEITSLETELTDYAAKFKEVTQRNEEVFKNYLFSLEKLSNLVTDTKQPEVQTASIVSRKAVLNYLQSMFSRMKGGMTLLIPQVDDIPIDTILETKNHQRINLVSVLDPAKHTDLLKKLFSKPNVRVRRVDVTKFEGVDKYVAADRDGEEVIIGITEDQGETVAIASYSDAFVTLMGKIVLGDYFLARSIEITRTEVGM